MSDQKLGNPAVVGLAGFGTTTLLLQFHNLGLAGDVSAAFVASVGRPVDRSAIVANRKSCAEGMALEVGGRGGIGHRDDAASCPVEPARLAFHLGRPRGR